MKEQLLTQLKTAQGQSDFVIAVVADIRGFSDFSRRNESPNTAMFVKRFYIELLTTYFPNAAFVKLTGDGMLMTFPYDEASLRLVSEDVISSCFRCLDAFPTICKDDPMINFEVPQSLGFGIARGTACRLFSGNQVLDYSGHLLNLASRLNDLARPKGIVIDGAFRLELVPDALKDRFVTQKVFIRGIAEETAVEVLCLANQVSVPESNLVPIGTEIWKSHTYQDTVGRIVKLTNRFRVDLPGRAKPGRVRAEATYAKKGVRNVANILSVPLEFSGDTSSPYVTLNLAGLKEALTKQAIPQSRKVTIKIEYIQEPLPRVRTDSGVPMVAS